MKSLSEFLRFCDSRFESHGFDRAAFMALLSDVPTHQQVITTTIYPQGAAHLAWFRIDEAACIIEGYPMQAANGWNEDPPSVAVMIRAIIDAQNDLEIDTARDLYVQRSHYVSHESIMGWCHKRGLNWPLKPATLVPSVVGAIDAVNLSQRLAEAELQTGHLNQMLAAVTGERDKLRQELQHLANVLVSSKKDAEQSKADLQTAAADLLQGKSKTSALKLVGGMAMALYGMPIHGARLSGITELAKDLDRVGVTISEDVIRANLKAAAEIIEPPKPRQS